MAERRGEIGQERLGLSGREDERRTALEVCFKSAKKLEFQARLGLQGSPTVSTKRRHGLSHSPAARDYAIFHGP